MFYKYATKNSEQHMIVAKQNYLEAADEYRHI